MTRFLEWIRFSNGSKATAKEMVAELLRGNGGETLWAREFSASGRKMLWHLLCLLRQCPHIRLASITVSTASARSKIDAGLLFRANDWRLRTRPFCRASASDRLLHFLVSPVVAPTPNGRGRSTRCESDRGRDDCPTHPGLIPRPANPADAAHIDDHGAKPDGRRRCSAGGISVHTDGKMPLVIDDPVGLARLTFGGCTRISRS